MRRAPGAQNGMAFVGPDFPTLVSYLASLPDGVASYPNVTLKGSVMRQVIASAREFHVPFARLDPVLRAYDETLPSIGVYVPEVHSIALRLITFDVGFNGQKAAYEEYMFRQNLALLGGPLYRILFMVISPERAFIGAKDKWGTFRRGTTIELVEKGRHAVTVQLTHPPGLYPEIARIGIAGALRATLHATGAKLPRVDAEEISPTVSRFVGRWM